jgi:hypothetical protein
VLKGHRQRGKRFVPPFLEYLNLTETRWLGDLLPELIWIALLIDHFEKKHGAELCVELAKAAAACSSTAPGAFAFISEYSGLQSSEQQCVIGKLVGSGVLSELSDALQVLTTYYPECPLAFIWSHQAPAAKSEDSLHRLKLLIGELTDRRGIAATFVQATAVYVYFLNDKLKVFTGSALADFTAVEAYPSTDASVKVASFVRALINGFPGPLDLSSHWRNYFWNRGRRLESCEGIENGGE